MSKEQIFKMIEGRIETMQTLAIECIDLIYNAGYNEAIEAAAIEAENDHGSYCEEVGNEIRKLKK